jgi:hypothetical protein
LSGRQAAYSDYLLYGMFLWARATSNKKLMKDDNPINLWIMPIDDFYDGLGGSVILIK